MVTYSECDVKDTRISAVQQQRHDISIFLEVGELRETKYYYKFGANGH